VDWTDNLFGTTSTILLALNGWGYWSIVLGHLAGATVRAGLQVYLSGWRPSLTCSREALRDLIPFGLGLHSKRLLEYAVGNVDNLVVGRILGMTALGYYDKAFTTTNRLATRLTLGQAPFRIFSIIHEDVERFRRAYTRLILAITLLTYPVLTGCMVVATPLLTVLFGEKWLPSVVPFQVLAVCGMLKVLNAYAGQANEASGNIWAQVRRMAVGSVLVIVGAGVGSRYGGVTGAAVGVLVAMVILTVSLQALVRKATGLTWRLMLTPQIPAVTCAAALAVVLLATGGVLRGLVPNPAAWQLLLVQTTVGAIFYVAFTLYSPFVSVRELVLEFTQDLVPARVRQALGLRTPEARPAQAMQASTCDSSPRDNAGDGEQ
jgi:PST family polysaccharide transporter